MIYTLTVNPSLDYYLKVNNLKSGTVNRTSSERLTVGGKGINVSLALKALGEDTVALGFVAGFTGDEIKREVKELGLDNILIGVEGRSRINVKIKSTAETDINGEGAFIPRAAVDELIKILSQKLKAGDYLVISGHAPHYLGEGIYGDIIESLRDIKGINFIVDANGGLLTGTLKYKPFLIKPNLRELCEVFGISQNGLDLKKITAYARELQMRGARNVLVSLGVDGAMMVTENDQALFVRATRGQLVNSVGAGDCMIAGFIHEYMRTNNYFKSLVYATASGSACAFTEGIPTPEQIEYIENLML